jgi:serine/threonine protein kinase
MDYVPGSDLYSRLQETVRLSKDEARFYAAEILLGLEHLHKAGYVHQDLKPENVLIDKDGHAKITHSQKVALLHNFPSQTSLPHLLFQSNIS